MSTAKHEHLDEYIISLRREGKTCRETAEIVGVAEPVVWNCMRRYGLQGMTGKGNQRNKRAARLTMPRKASVEAADAVVAKISRGNPSAIDNWNAIEQALQRHDHIHIELGYNGGYLVAFDDQPGEERTTIPAAIRAAEHDMTKEDV